MKWDLSQEAFDRLLALFDPDRDKAAVRYEEMRRKLAKFFQWRGCSAAEELVDETFDRVARRVGEGVQVWVENPYSYVRSVATRVAQEFFRSAGRQVRTIDELPERAETPPAETDETRLDCLDECLAALSAESRRLLEAYHEGRGLPRIQARRTLADNLGIPINALRIRAFRVRAGLMACIDDCARRPRNESAPAA